MLVVPVENVDTIPDEEPMLATPVLLLTHAPPPTVLLSVLLNPLHTDKLPDILAGEGLTVTTTVTGVHTGVL